MSDGKRERLLARFNYVLAHIPTLTVTRNEATFSSSDRPIANQLDGDESLPDDDSANAGGSAKSTVTLLPIVDLMVGSTPERSGPKVNEWRAKIVKAVLADGTQQRPPAVDGSLAHLVGVRGRVKYLGLGTRFTHNYQADCDVSMRFAIVATFDPNDP